MSEATRTGRRSRLTRSSVLGAALDLLDEQGFEAFSMIRLGDRLHVTTMALYRHVSDRADLERALVEMVLADLVVPTDAAGPWPDAIASWMHQVRGRWLRHPWLGRLLGNRAELSPPWLVALDRLARILDHAGLPAEVVARELVRISRATAGTVMLENAAPVAHSASLFASLAEPDRTRWRPIATQLERYDDDDVFADLTADTVARLHSILATTNTPPKDKHP